MDKRRKNKDAYSYSKRQIINTNRHKELDDAYYQYIIDHSIPSYTGMKCIFHYKNKADLKRRVRSRVSGVERKKNANDQNALKSLERKMYIYNLQLSKINNSWWRKLLFRLLIGRGR